MKAALHVANCRNVYIEIKVNLLSFIRRKIKLHTAMYIGGS